MTQIEKIRAEIKRLKDARAFFDDNNQLAYWDGLNKALSFIDTLEAGELPAGLNEAARRYAIPLYMKDIDESHFDEYPYSKESEAAFKAGAEWMAGQGYSEVADVWSFGKNGIPAIFVDDAMYLPENEFKPGDKVIVQIRKKQ